MSVAEAREPGEGPQPSIPRVLLFLHSFEAGGVERVALRLAGAWAAAGWDVRIAMGRRGGALEPEAPAGVRLIFAPSFAWAAHCESLWLVPHLVATVRRERPDVLFCAGNTYAIVAVLARLVLGAACPPIVCKVSNSLVRQDLSPPMRWFYGRWLRLQTRYIECFVGLAERTRPELAQALRLPPGRIAVVPDPALRRRDIPTGSARPRPDRRSGGRLFVAVGRLVPQKDFALLLRAFAARAGASDRLAILGEGRERPRLAHLAGQLGVAQRVELPGHVADVAAWLDRADAFVLSSRYEGVPAVLIEALAQGTPVVATDCCVSMRDLLRDGELGEITPVGDVQALAQAMGRVGERTHDVAAMRAQVQEFTVERASARYLGLMAALIVAARP